MAQLLLLVFVGRVNQFLNNQGLGPVSQKFRKLLEPVKSFVNLRHAYSVKRVFSCVVKGITIKRTFRASRGLRFEDTWRIMSPEVLTKSFGTSEKRAPGGLLLKAKDIVLIPEGGMPVGDHIGLF